MDIDPFKETSQKRCLFKIKKKDFLKLVKRMSVGSI